MDSPLVQSMGRVADTWEDSVRKTLSAVMVNLRRVKPNSESMVSTVSDLAVEVGRQNLFKHVEPCSPDPTINQKACEVRSELEGLAAALSEGNVPKAMTHAEAALLLTD